MGTKLKIANMIIVMAAQLGLRGKFCLGDQTRGLKKIEPIACQRFYNYFKNDIIVLATLAALFAVNSQSYITE